MSERGPRVPPPVAPKVPAASPAKPPLPPRPAAGKPAPLRPLPPKPAPLAAEDRTGTTQVKPFAAPAASPPAPPVAPASPAATNAKPPALPVPAAPLAAPQTASPKPPAVATSPHPAVPAAGAAAAPTTLPLVQAAPEVPSTTHDTPPPPSPTTAVGIPAPFVDPSPAPPAAKPLAEAREPSGLTAVRPMTKPAGAAGDSGPRPAYVLPKVEWSSVPPPMPPRSFSSDPPPPSTAPITPRFTEEQAREQARLHDLRHVEEIRDEARAMLRQALEESLAPLHYSIQALERRMGEVERRLLAQPPMHVTTPPAPLVAAVTASPVSAPPRAPAEPASPMIAQPVTAAPAARAPSNPYGNVIAAPGAGAGPRPMVASYGDVPFDGAKRRRRVVVRFVLLLVFVFGPLFAALVWSRVR